jgi:vancomycin resistance protein YoaR
VKQPRDAAFEIVGKRVRVVPSKRGRGVSVKATAAALVAGVGSPEVQAKFEPSIADLTTREAKAMKIRQRVSEFTTPYSCCQNRVVNIQRAAEILDGQIIKAGTRFSLNQALGERTTERGFLPAPMISAGRLVDAVGGGVSQVATTMYNAAFFAGLDLIAHTPHEFYISRYPMGREATVSWGGPELIFRNDWPAAILIEVIATDTSITVRFYSSKLGRRVETTTGEPHSYVAPSTIRVYNSALPPGSESVVQSGGISGFTVEYTRKVFAGDELKRDERWVVNYRPENTIVEYGPAPKPASSGGSDTNGSAGGDGGEGGGSTGGENEPPPPEEPASGETPPA